MNRFMRGLLAVPVVVASLLGVQATTAPPAEASSTNCTFYGDPLPYKVRNGQFCSTINGSGTNVNFVTGNFGSTIPARNAVCNPSIKLDVYDRYGRWITWRQGAQKSGCSWGTWNSTHTIGVNWSFPAAAGGYIMVTLQDSGRPVAVVRGNLG